MAKKEKQNTEFHVLLSVSLLWILIILFNCRRLIFIEIAKSSVADLVLILRRFRPNSLDHFESL